MNFDVYCDESRPDLFASKRNETGRFMLIGSVWFSSKGWKSPPRDALGR